MASSGVRYGLVLLAFHFFLILLVSAHDILWLVGQGLTIAPASLTPLGKTGADLTSRFLQRKGDGKASPFHAALATYLQCTGIESPYGYFAPNIPEGSQLVFEMHFPDGRIEYELPAVNSSAAGLRLVGLLDRLARPSFASMREYILRKMVESVRHDHPDVLTVRALFSLVDLPNISEFEKEERPSSELLFIYEFEKGTEHGQLIQ